jgi:hypothetical protein
LEVRRSCDGRPPVTERERDIRLNGICGVIFLKARAAKAVRAFFVLMLVILILILISSPAEEQDHDQEQELKLCTFARDESC